MRRTLIVIIVLAMFLAFSPVLAQGTFNVRRHIIPSGGTSSGRLIGAIGQPVAGTVQNDRTLCSGFWCGDTKLIAQAGKALITYSFTFGQMGIVAASLLLIVLISSHTLYDVVMQLWLQRSSSR